MSLSNLTTQDCDQQPGPDFWAEPADLVNPSADTDTQLLTDMPIDPSLRIDPDDDGALSTQDRNAHYETCEEAKDNCTHRQYHASSTDTGHSENTIDVSQGDTAGETSVEPNPVPTEFVQSEHQVERSESSVDIQSDLPIVPPPDYIVRHGVRLTSTGKVSRKSLGSANQLEGLPVLKFLYRRQEGSSRSC